MALKGNLRDFTLTQLLNLINLAHKTGSLFIDGPGASAWVYFREGALAYAQVGQEDNSLAMVLFKANKLNAAQHKIISERAGRISDKELGLLLINASYLSQQDILVCLQKHFSAILNRLFTWPEGFFRFDNELTPPGDRITVRVSLENIIIEGTRQLREWSHLQEEIPSLEMALKFSDRPGANIRNINLRPEEWRVVSYINPKNSMHQIARATRMNELDFRRVIYSLLQAGLVEIIRPAGQPLPARTPLGRFQVTPIQTQAPGGKAEKKTLVQRIINRIRSL